MQIGHREAQTLDTLADENLVSGRRRWVLSGGFVRLCRLTSRRYPHPPREFHPPLDHDPILGATIALDVDGLVQLAGDPIAHLIGNLRDVRLGVTQVNVTTRRNAHDNGIILVGIGMSLGLVTFARSAGKPLVSMGVTTMKMINNTSMMSAMGMTLGDDIVEPTFGL